LCNNVKEEPLCALFLLAGEGKRGGKKVDGEIKARFEERESLPLDGRTDGQRERERESKIKCKRNALENPATREESPTEKERRKLTWSGDEQNEIIRGTRPAEKSNRNKRREGRGGTVEGAERCCGQNEEL
ncbi:hypothetical protein K0M31_016567, partial [Melipona bicolor]